MKFIWGIECLLAQPLNANHSSWQFRKEAFFAFLSLFLAYFAKEVIELLMVYFCRQDS